MVQPSRVRQRKRLQQHDSGDSMLGCKFTVLCSSFNGLSNLLSIPRRYIAQTLSARLIRLHVIMRPSKKNASAGKLYNLSKAGRGFRCLTQYQSTRSTYRGFHRLVVLIQGEMQVRSHSVIADRGFAITPPWRRRPPSVSFTAGFQQVGVYVTMSS